VGATVLALFPLALHGGPLWQALCYAQIGGLTLATAVTLFLVPGFFAGFVLDLKIVRWKTTGRASARHVGAEHPVNCDRHFASAVAGPGHGQPHPCSAPKALVTAEAPPPQRAGTGALGAPAPAARMGRPRPRPPARGTSEMTAAHAREGALRME